MSKQIRDLPKGTNIRITNSGWFNDGIHTLVYDMQGLSNIKAYSTKYGKPMFCSNEHISLVSLVNVIGGKMR